jgi:hypothetical protein
MSIVFDPGCRLLKWARAASVQTVTTVSVLVSLALIITGSFRVAFPRGTLCVAHTTSPDYELIVTPMGNEFVNSKMKVALFVVGLYSIGPTSLGVCGHDSPEAPAPNRSAVISLISGGMNKSCRLFR